MSKLKFVVRRTVCGFQTGVDPTYECDRLEVRGVKVIRYAGGEQVLLP